MKVLAGIVALALVACASTADVVQTGPATYRVRAVAGSGPSSDAEIKERGIKRATEFCEANGKRAVVIVGQSSGWHWFSVQNAEVNFSCDEPQSAPPATKASPS
jgi:hypothetical protein